LECHLLALGAVVGAVTEAQHYAQNAFRRPGRRLAPRAK